MWKLLKTSQRFQISSQILHYHLCHNESMLGPESRRANPLELIICPYISMNSIFQSHVHNYLHSQTFDNSRELSAFQVKSSGGRQREILKTGKYVIRTKILFIQYCKVHSVRWSEFQTSGQLTIAQLVPECIKPFIQYDCYLEIYLNLYSPVAQKSERPSFTNYTFKSKITISFKGSFSLRTMTNTLETF